MQGYYPRRKISPHAPRGEASSRGAWGLLSEKCTTIAPARGSSRPCPSKSPRSCAMWRIPPIRATWKRSCANTPGCAIELAQLAELLSGLLVRDRPRGAPQRNDFWRGPWRSSPRVFAGRRPAASRADRGGRAKARSNSIAASAPWARRGQELLALLAAWSGKQIRLQAGGTDRERSAGERGSISGALVSKPRLRSGAAFSAAVGWCIASRWPPGCRSDQLPHAGTARPPPSRRGPQRAIGVPSGRVNPTPRASRNLRRRRIGRSLARGE